MNCKRAFYVLICSVFGTLIFVHLFDSVTLNFEGIELLLSLKMALKGSTTINLPPFGVLKANTHSSPVDIILTLKSIDLDLVKTLINSKDKNDLILLFKKDIEKAIYLLAGKTIFLGTAGMTFTAFLFKLKKKEFLVCAIISVVLLGLIFGTIYSTYDLTAFDKPEYFGTLKAAPWLIGFLNKGLSQLNELGKQLKDMSDGISTVFAKLDNLASTEESVVRVLHVTDIHNNPVAFDFIEQIIKNFNIDFVIDTGDFTDFGTVLESNVIQKLSQLSVEYLFVAGNHDSQTTLELIKEIKNVTVLNGQMITIKGINILGFPDASSNDADIDTPNEAEIKELRLKIMETLKLLNGAVDILAVHNPKVTQDLDEEVPIILNGHLHKNSLSFQGDSIIINAGTTGAAGIRGIQTKGDIPYSAVVLYFRKNEYQEKPQLFAADVIKISNLKIGFQVERIFLDQEDGR